MAAAVPNEPGNLAEAILVAVVVVVTAQLFLVRVFDTAGRLLATFGGKSPDP